MFSTSPRVERLQELIEADGFNQGGHFLLGEEYFRQGRFMNAAAKFRRVVELNPDHADAWRRMGDAYGALAIGKEAQNAYLDAARAYARSGQPAEAAACENLAKQAFAN